MPGARFLPCSPRGSQECPRSLMPAPAAGAVWVTAGCSPSRCPGPARFPPSPAAPSAPAPRRPVSSSPQAVPDRPDPVPTPQRGCSFCSGPAPGRWSPRGRRGAVQGPIHAHRPAEAAATECLWACYFYFFPVDSATNDQQKGGKDECFSDRAN